MNITVTSQGNLSYDMFVEKRKIGSPYFLTVVPQLRAKAIDLMKSPVKAEKMHELLSIIQQKH